MSFLGEIKRRKAIQVAAVYAVVAWLIMQVVDVVNEPLNLPDWFDTVAIMLLAIGFPITLVMTWAFELTSDGVVRDQSGSVTTAKSGKSVNYILAGLLIVSAAWIGFRELNPPTSAGADILPNSVAVLPFASLSPDPDDAFYADGFHIELLNSLHKIQDLKAIARDSVAQYRDSSLTNQELASQLRVGAVVRGDVRYAGNNVRVSVRLIDPNTDVPVWSEIYAGSTTDVFEFQADIAEQVAMAVEATLLPDEKESLDRAPTDSPEAYAAYLKAIQLLPGLQFIGLGSRAPGFLALLDQAITLDPDFALAYAHKAKIGDDVESQRADLDHALRLDPNLGFAHLVSAHLFKLEGAAGEARQAFEQALRLSPNDPEVLAEYAFFNQITGEQNDAAAFARRALELNPRFGTHFTLGRLYALSGDILAARDAFRQSATLNPDNPATHNHLGFVEVVLGNREEAARRFELRDSLRPQGQGDNAYTFAMKAFGYSLLDRSDDVDRLITEHERALPNDRAIEVLSIWNDVAAVYAALARGDEVQALASLETLTGEQNSLHWQVNQFKVNEWKHPILDKPEFVEVRSRLGFTGNE